jgi:DNA primase
MTTIEQIKSKLDIVEEIGAIVPLKKSGKAYKGVCPFHSERTPSFYVFPQTSTWRCFGCNEGGDIFTFVEKQQALEFKDVLELLAEKAGVSLETRGEVLPGSEEEDQEEGARRRLRQINEAAAIWFHHLLLTSSEAIYARSYLETRGVSRESLSQFRLGYAPAGGDLLCAYLLGQGYSAQEISNAGLGREREASRGGGLYDYFHNRLIFPIRDARGRTIAFGGRELGGGSPKYLNTPQTPLFDKSATLYGLDMAREAIKRRDQVVIVEGYMDALIAHQYGEKNVVACIGSAITEKQVRQIKKLTKRLALALDPDTAGESATLRGIEVAQQGFDRTVVAVPIAIEGTLKSRRGVPRGMVRFEEQVDAEITVLRLPPSEDPDETIRRDLALWRRAIAEALPLVDFLFEAYTKGLRLETPQGKAEAARRLLPVLLEVHDRVKQDAYLRRLAAMLRTEERPLRQQLEALRQAQLRDAHHSADVTEPGPKSYPHGSDDETAGNEASHNGSDTKARRPVPRLGSPEFLEDYCLGLLLVSPPLAAEIYGILETGDFAQTEARVLYHAFLTTLQAGGSLSTQQVISTLPRPVQELAEDLRQRVEAGPPMEHARLKKAVTDAAYRLKRIRLQEAITELRYLQKEAEQAEDQEGLRLLKQRTQELLPLIHTIDAAVPLYG